MNYEMDNKIDNTIEYEQELQAGGTTEFVPSEKKAIRKRKKKRKKKHYLLKFLLLVALCIAVYYFLHSPVFTVEKIVMEENEYMTLEQVRELTGYKKGMNLFEIDARDKQNELEKDTYIKEADIDRKLPDTIRITLILREKTAVVQSEKGYVLIDNEGVVIDVLKQTPQYTILSGLTVKDASKGKVIEVKETKKYEQYMDLIQQISDADMYFARLELNGKTLNAYATDKLYCTGTVDNVVQGMEDGNLQSVFYDLMQKNITKGVVTVGDDQYYSFGK